MQSFGVPKKKRTFDLLATTEVIGDCYLCGSVLYVLHDEYREEDDVHFSYVKEIELKHFCGDESALENIFYAENAGVSNVTVQADVVVLTGEKNVLLDRKSKSVKYAEHTIELPEHWKSSYRSYTNGSLLYRQIDGLNTELGFVVVDLSTGKAAGSVNFDAISLLYFDNDLFVGVTRDEYMAIYSIEEKRCFIELDPQQYFDCPIGRQFSTYVSSWESYVVVGRKCGVVLIDKTNGTVIDKISVVNMPELREAMVAHNQKNENVVIKDVSLVDDEIIVSGGFVVNYLMRFKLVGGKLSLQWSNVTPKAIRSKYVGGDIIYGIQDSRPAAWDLFSGEKIWEGSMGTIANKIQVGDGWLVYSAPAGYIQCFEWKKPYISPHRSAKS